MPGSVREFAVCAQASWVSEKLASDVRSCQYRTSRFSSPVTSPLRQELSMRRIFVVALLALAACAKKEQQAGDTTSAAATPAGGSAAAAPASITAADVAGTWDATAMPMNKDTVVVRFEMNAKSTNDGWTMKFLPNGPSPA